MRAGLVIASACLLAGCGERGAGQGANGATQGAAPAPMPVTVLEARRESVPLTVDAVGQALGSREIEVRARVSGILEKRAYREGASVEAGAALFSIDRKPFEIVQAQARANLLQALARRDQARREAMRLKPLAEERAISRKEADDAQSLLDQYEAAVAQAEAQVKDAELNLSYTSVTAPISGITGRALRSEGTLVSAGGDSALLTTLVQVDPVWVLFSVSQAEYQRIRSAGGRASVKLLNAGGLPGPAVGTINFSASTVDARLSTVQLRATFPNPVGEWLPGQFVRVRVLAGEQQAFLVPQQAVSQGELNRSVWVVGPDDKAVSRVVQTGVWSGANWVITGGLEPGDRVIVDNLIKLRPGVPVQPVSR